MKPVNSIIRTLIVVEIFFLNFVMYLHQFMSADLVFKIIIKIDFTYLHTY